MSYWIYLQDAEGKSLPVSTHSEGGTYVLGGCVEAELNVTYNYAKHFDFRSLEGRTGKETAQELTFAVEKLGMTRDPDYWKPTEGNVGHCLSILLWWALRHPTGKWHVS